MDSVEGQLSEHNQTGTVALCQIRIQILLGWLTTWVLAGNILVSSRTWSVRGAKHDDGNGVMTWNIRMMLLTYTEKKWCED